MTSSPLSPEEFAVMRSAIDANQALTGEDAAAQARRYLNDATVEAAKSLVNLALYASKENVRFQAAALILDRNLGRVQDTPPKPPEDIFKSIMADVARKVEDYANDPSDLIPTFNEDGSPIPVEDAMEKSPHSPTCSLWVSTGGSVNTNMCDCFLSNNVLRDMDYTLTEIEADND